jgi:hypothetical protein
MNKSNVISFKLEKLENEVVELFSELRNKRPVYNFLEGLDFDKCNKTKLSDLVELAVDEDVLEMLPIIEMRSEIDWGTFDVHVLKIDENGLTCCDYNDTSKIETYGFKDVSSINYRLIILNEMYNIK